MSEASAEWVAGRVGTGDWASHRETERRDTRAGWKGMRREKVKRIDIVPRETSCLWGREGGPPVAFSTSLSPLGAVHKPSPWVEGMC